MGVFDDKKFEQLDWISQAVEPIDNKLNDLLGKLPDEHVITQEEFFLLSTESYAMYLSIDRIIRYLIKKVDHHSYVHQHDTGILCDYFRLETEGDIIVDYEARTVSGIIKMIKTAQTMDESTLKSLLGAKGIDKIRYTQIVPDNLTRANDILEILGGCEEGLRTRSAKVKKQVLYTRMTKIFDTNDWNIKDTELADKVGYWIHEYIVDGNLSSYSNICRLKVMTHRGQPIYSMEEMK